MTYILDNPLVSRFESYIHKTETCWLWEGPIAASGYGLFCYRGERTRAHRVSYWLFIGPLADGKLICHSCDVKLCVNPKHLWQGTYSQNSVDMVQKGRQSFQQNPELIPRGKRHWQNKYPELRLRGEKNASAKLTETSIINIRTLRSEGVDTYQLSYLFKVHVGTINKIVRRDSWNHV